MAMLERNEKGKQVRRYFIQIEKKYKGSRSAGIPTGKQLMAIAVIEAQKTETGKERMRPKEIFADAVTASHSSILIGELAKIIRQNGIDTGEKRLFQWMRQEGYLIRRNGTDYCLYCRYCCFCFFWRRCIAVNCHIRNDSRSDFWFVFRTL